jgi:hypothetical protein
MPVEGMLPSSWSDGRDLAAWISVVIGSLSLPLQLRWSEGRVEKKINAPFNKGVVVCLLLQRDGGETRFFQAGLGGEGENACTSVICILEELLAGHGGEEELSRIVISAFASCRPYPFCYWCGGSAPTLEARARAAKVLLLFCTGGGVS